MTIKRNCKLNDLPDKLIIDSPVFTKYQYRQYQTIDFDRNYYYIGKYVYCFIFLNYLIFLCNITW